jgi:folate-binding protein YgfZ
MINLGSCQKLTGSELAMVELKYLSVARLHGPDAGDFLHRQLSADIAPLAPGDASFACCCTPKGQVIGLLLVCREGDDFLVTGSAELLPLVLKRLRMFVLRSRVEFSVGPGLKVYGVDSTSELSAVGTFQPGGLGLHYRFSQEPDAVEMPDDLFRAAEISHRVAWLGAETTEKFIPQMLGYEEIGAVSFSKGCYPGQEIVARARYLGKVKRKPVIVRTIEPLAVKPADHVELLRGETWSPGVVITSAAADNGTLFFIVASIEPEGDPVELRYGERTYRCARM